MAIGSDDNLAVGCLLSILQYKDEEETNPVYVRSPTLENALPAMNIASFVTSATESQKFQSNITLACH